LKIELRHFGVSVISTCVLIVKFKIHYFFNALAVESLLLEYHHD